MAQVKLVKNSDYTVTIRYGRRVRHIPSGLPKSRLFDEIKWGAIGMDAKIPDVTIIEFLNEYQK